ncbi:hypothetical protein IB237_03785 [Agrobacterium sp. AGB01]|uniref:hypothetical protein n=1 Tax=Agrobacterium sp. AGB01 TaxID=2769302 RepID=UPI00177DBE9E|nr:hypothetical protein [Agrobacterium sp. AGB01]MBD9386288.1 hypothetical protein [Agrobacterium sp. AGB01]
MCSPFADLKKSPVPERLFDTSISRGEARSILRVASVDEPILPGVILQRPQSGVVAERHFIHRLR